MKDSRWDGKLTNFKVSEEAFPELYKELSRLHHRGRSDRLRSLAQYGLMYLHQTHTYAQADQYVQADNASVKRKSGKSVEVVQNCSENDPECQSQSVVRLDDSLRSTDDDTGDVAAVNGGDGNAGAGAEEKDNQANEQPLEQAGEKGSSTLSAESVVVVGDSMKSERSALNSKLLGGLLTD